MKLLDLVIQTTNMTKEDPGLPIRMTQTPENWIKIKILKIKEIRERSHPIGSAAD